MKTPKRPRCCPDHARVCSRSRKLFAEAVKRADKTAADFGAKPRRCWRELFQEAEEEPRPEPPSDFVKLRSRRSRQAHDKKTTCGCDLAAGSLEEMTRGHHKDICVRSLCWVVRVPYETQAGRAACADSIRLCRADAVRLANEYQQHKKVKILRVFPLYVG